MSSVTLSLAKAHLNIDHSSDDELIQLYLDAADDWFQAQTGRKIADLSPVPADIKLAMLKLAAFYYMHREAVSYGDAVRLAPYGVQAVANSYRERWFGEPAPEDTDDEF
ncbi:putative phage protein (predicted DNA packaging) [Bosea robiniae]|uniref:head-tail connector protein n=1 Tax=Bosea TaxID=85413 RepID=UPI0028563A8F|nr:MULTISPECIES: head-tail connector protein [Bosea]MDR6831340.1 putative phage protein (predicted DNA packaging) [Bosea robiniae]MDR6898092.1 putative phage protein (predicted DNA packaging) [Bosea sp. BE109]MDR7141477.1 putative phage protein (predicted DNA packaging) [Bosea sp. BE168]